MKKLILILLILLVSNISESQTVTPKLEYVTNYGNGVYLALWGYQNSSSNNVTIPISSSANKFSPTPRDRGQPTVFLPGRQYNVFNTTLTYGSSLNWKINSESFTAYSRNFLVYVTDSLTTMPPVGNTVKYYIKAKNSENTTWNFVTIKDTLPAGTSFVSATGGGTCAGNVVTWIPGNISEGNSVNVTVTVSVTSSLPAYVNKVWAYSSSTYRAVAYDENTGQQGSTITENFIMTFEDLKGYGWNDWDMNDFVSGVKATIYLNGSSAVTQLKFEYEALARGSTYIHALKHFIPVTGSSTGTLTVRDSNNIIIPSLSFTNRNYSGAINETIFPSTMEALPPMSVTNQTANTHPSQQGVIKGYTAVFIITFAPTDATNLINHYSDIYISVRPATPYTQLIHVADLAGSFGNTQTVSNQGAISSQLYGYYLDLGNKVPYNWHWPREGVNYPLWSSYTKYTNFILSSKVVNSDWYNYPDTAKTWNKRNVPPTDFISLAQSQKSTASGIFRRGSYNPDYLYDVKIAKFFASPKTADINNDGKLEVLIGALDNKFYAIDYNGNNLPGFPITTSSFIKSTAAVYKNTGGSSLIAFGNDDGDLYLLNQNGQAQSGFPKNIGYSIKASPVFSNLFGNDQMYLITFAGDGKLYVYDTQGNSLQGFPKKIQNIMDLYGNFILLSTPAVFDLYGDGTKEIVAGTVDSNIVIVSTTGSVLSTTKLDGGIVSTPHIIKINNQVKIIAATSTGTVYRLSHNGLVESSRSAGSEFVSSPVAADLNNDNNIEIITATMDGNVSLIQAYGSMEVIWQIPVGQEVIATPLIADIDGNNDLNILLTVKGGYLLGLTKEGYQVDSVTAASLAPFDSWLISTPSIGDVDGNGKLDVVAASFDSTLKTFELPYANSNSQIVWGMFGGNLGNTNVSPTNIKQVENALLPEKFKLEQNFPNPFNPVTQINFAIPTAGFVSLKIYDVTGKEISSLVNQNLKEGSYKVNFDGSVYSSGVYIYKLTSGQFSGVRKMMLIK